MNISKKHQYYIFDLDNTLYDELDYLKVGYQHIAVFISNKTQINSKYIYNYLINEFECSGRDRLFNKLLNNFDLNIEIMDDILKIIRVHKHKEKIQLYNGIKESLLKLISNSKDVFVITNGNVDQQKNKVKYIEWHGLDKYIRFIYANAYSKKPKVESFNYIKKKYNVKPRATIMIGDSKVDRQFAENCNIDFQFIYKGNIMKN